MPLEKWKDESYVSGGRGGMGDTQCQKHFQLRWQSQNVFSKNDKYYVFLKDVIEIIDRTTPLLELRLIHKGQKYHFYIISREGSNSKKAMQNLFVLKITKGLCGCCLSVRGPLPSQVLSWAKYLAGSESCNI